MVETVELEAPARAARGSIGSALASFLLGGLTAMEVLALVVAFVSVVGLLWLTGTVAPERLVTTPWLRAGWSLAVLAVLRPLTWILYGLVFVAARALAARAAPRSRAALRNLGGHLLALAATGLSVAATFVLVDGAARWTASVAGFALGTVDVAGLGHVSGRWDGAHVVAALSAFLLIRPVLPPIGLDLDLRARPLLWFVEGPRGRADAWLLALACAGGLVVAAIAALRALSG